MKAISITHEAAEKGFMFYVRKSKIHGINPTINKEIFSRLIDGAVLLSQQTIEAESLSANFLFFPPDIKLNEIPASDSWFGAIALPIEGVTLSELSFEHLKPYLSSATDSSSFLIISATNDNKFIFQGILYMAMSIDSVVSINRRIWMIDSFQKILSDNLRIAVHDRRVTMSLGTDPILRIEKGSIHEISDFENEINSTLDVSTTFFEDAHTLTEKINHEFKSLGYANGKCREIRPVARKVLREIVTAIMDEHHGATLVFGSAWDLNDESRFQRGAIKVKIPLGSLILQKMHLFDVVWMRCKGFDDDLQQDQDEFVISEKLRAMQNAIIMLSKTDGAVIFDRNLNVIGIGTFLKMTSTVDSPGGARRKSADSFVKANHGVAIIVISKDGKVYLVL
ncbi:MAG: diadenylate cyclase [Methanotrichaceae archaeon]|nr:diadenylate cyclase [Methanotrichaceae archaeon]